MSTDQEREAFEHYFSDGGKSPRTVERDAKGDYRMMQAYAAWRVWQARAAMAPAGEPIDRADVLRLFAEYRSMMVQAVSEASQGNDITAGSLELAAEDAAGELVRLLGGE